MDEINEILAENSKSEPINVSVGLNSKTNDSIDSNATMTMTTKISHQIVDLTNQRDNNNNCSHDNVNNLHNSESTDEKMNQSGKIKYFMNNGYNGHSAYNDKIHQIVRNDKFLLEMMKSSQHKIPTRLENTESAKLPEIKHNEKAPYIHKTHNSWMIEDESNVETKSFANTELSNRVTDYLFIEGLKLEASKYSSLKDFSRYSNEAFILCLKYNCLQLSCGHMKNFSHLYWNMDTCKQSSMLFSSLKEFKLKNPGTKGSSIYTSVVVYSLVAVFRCVRVFIIGRMVNAYMQAYVTNCNDRSYCQRRECTKTTCFKC